MSFGMGAYDNNNSVIQKVSDAVIEYMRDGGYSILPRSGVMDSDFFEDKLFMTHFIRRGIPFSLFDQIREFLPFSEEEWALFLNISTKTLQRHRKEDSYVFKPIHTEKIMELAEVYFFGLSVFDSMDQFNLWLHSPSFALGNFKPFDLLKDSYGKGLVMDELNRIDQGIFV